MHPTLNEKEKKTGYLVTPFQLQTFSASNGKVVGHSGRAV
jgi:hypothetical protein